jgi:hypothetical protein
MSFFQDLLSQYGGQADDVMNGKAQTMNQRQWTPQTPQDSLGQVTQPMAGGMMAMLPQQDAMGQQTPPQLTAAPAPEAQPTADPLAPVNYGGIVQKQADTNKPMDMGSMMSMLQGGLGSYTAKPTEGTGEKGIIGKAFQSYVSALAGGMGKAKGGG